MKELILDAVLENIDTVIDFVCTALASCNVNDSIQNELAVAAEEVFVNISNYAYAPQTGTVRLCIEVTDGQVRMRFEDSGNPYNPLDRLDPDLTLPVDERPIGGLGIFMVKNIMDTVQYRYENSKNQLTLVKVIQ